MKRYVFLIAIFMIVTALFSYAEENITKYSYETALKAAVENSIQPALDDFNIKAKESALEQAEKEALKGFIGGTNQEIVERRIIKEVAPLEAEAALDVAKRQKLDNENKFRAEVYEEMLKFIMAKNRVENKRERIALIREKYIIDSMQYHEGLVSKADIEDAEINLSIENLELVKLETELESNILNAKQKLHVDLSDDTKIDFEYELNKIGSQYVISSFNLEKAIEKAINRSTEIYQRQRAVDIARMKFDITKEHLKPGNDYYDQKEYELEYAKKSLYDARTNLEVSIRNAYNELLTSLDALDLAQKRLELEESRLKTLETKKDAGILSRRDMIDSEIAVLGRKLAVQEAILNFNINHDRLRNLLGD
ncbi:MAG: TolC family protein [Clostridiaceae bacterium]|nr:TolC family protein [Clostridiaceae bacterium]